MLLNQATVNYRIVRGLPKGVRIIDKPNSHGAHEGGQESIEVENTRRAHIKDGVVFTKFMYWLKTNIGKLPMTEISASDYLEERRREQDGFLELSFDTICAYGPNAAMMITRRRRSLTRRFCRREFFLWIPAVIILRERPILQERWRLGRSQTRCGVILPLFAAQT